jgi:hypothetical protein
MSEGARLTVTLEGRGIGLAAVPLACLLLLLSNNLEFNFTYRISPVPVSKSRHTVSTFTSRSLAILY